LPVQAPYFTPSGSVPIARTWLKFGAIEPVSWASVLNTGSQQIVSARARKSLCFFNASLTATAYICPAQDEFGNPLAATVAGAGCVPIPPGAGLTMKNPWSAFNGCASAAGAPFTVLEFFSGEVINGIFGGTAGSTPPTPTLLFDDGGWLVVSPAANYPTSATSLPAGSIWSNGALVTVVPGITPNPSAPPVFFGVVTAAALLALGGGNLPLTNPGAGSLQLWNSGGVVAVA
jgi:hypothetical protein